MYKYLVIVPDGIDLMDEVTDYWFPSEEDARCFMMELIKKAEEQAGDHDGKVPAWIYDVVLCRFEADIQDSMDGLRIRRIR